MKLANNVSHCKSTLFVHFWYTAATKKKTYYMSCFFLNKSSITGCCVWVCTIVACKNQCDWFTLWFLVTLPFSTKKNNNNLWWSLPQCTIIAQVFGRKKTIAKFQKRNPHFHQLKKKLYLLLLKKSLAISKRRRHAILPEIHFFPKKNQSSQKSSKKFTFFLYLYTKISSLDTKKFLG